MGSVWWAFESLLVWGTLKAMWRTDKIGTMRFFAEPVRRWIVNSSSWKTTVAGIGMILGAIGILCGALTSKTPVDWTTTGGAILAAITGGVGLLKARDNDKTSQDVGAVTKK